MRRIAFILCANLLMTLTSRAQFSAGKENIEKLCGCFEVVFKYAETFSPDSAYKFPPRHENTTALELALPIEISNKKISIQHLLVIDDNYIVKHWREDWVYEPSSIWKFQGNNLWTKENLTIEKIKGKWMQTVWEVSDAPRYQGVSVWATIDEKTFWQNTTDAPLPRREYTTRSDYTILRRSNKVVVNESGWIHEQDNQKILRKNGIDKLIAEEKGINNYNRVNDKNCDAAKIWWEKNSDYWKKVSVAWEKYTASHLSIRLKEKVDGRVLHQYLNEMAGEFAAKKIKLSEIDESINRAIEKFIDTEKEIEEIK